jgi:plasmid stabilization system protein ParE
MRKRMRLEWSAYALADRMAIFDYIEADSPQAAVAVDDRIREQVQTLARFPRSGRPGRIEGTRELVISRTPSQLEAKSVQVVGDAGSHVFDAKDRYW